MMLATLRADVEIVEEAGLGVFVDHLTGLRFEIGELSPSALLERLGRDAELATTLRSLGLLSEGLSPEEIRKRQQSIRAEFLTESRKTALRDLLEFATKEVPFYRQQRDVYDPSRIESLADLATLPLLRKADLRLQFPKGIVADGVDISGRIAARSLELTSTSGTTGERLQVFADMELDSIPDNYRELWGLPPSDDIPRTAVFTGPVCLGTECHLGKVPFEERIRGGTTLYLNSTDDLFSMKRELVENVAEELDRFRPEFLLVNPVYLHWLIRRASELSIRLPPVGLVLSCYQYLSHLQREGIQAALQAPVYGYYFATDLAGCRMGIECNHRRLHVREDQTLLEIVGPSGPRSSGEVGAIVATAIANRVMPLIRYLVGDVGSLSSVACPCGAGDWPCLEIHGRSKDMLFLDDRWTTTREIDEAIESDDGVDFYKCTQRSVETLTFEVIPKLGSQVRESMLKERMRSRFGVQVEVKTVSRLQPEASLKFRSTQSLVRTPPELL